MAGILSRSLYLQNICSHRNVNLGRYLSKIIVRNYEMMHSSWIRSDAEKRFKLIDNVSPDSELIYAMPFKKTVQAAYTVGTICTAAGLFSMAYLTHIIPGQDIMSVLFSEYYTAFVETYSLQGTEEELEQHTDLVQKISTTEILLVAPLFIFMNTVLIFLGRGVPLRMYYDPITEKYTAIIFTLSMIGKTKLQFSPESLKPAHPQSDMFFILNRRPMALCISYFRSPDDYYSLVGSIPN